MNLLPLALASPFAAALVVLALPASIPAAARGVARLATGFTLALALVLVFRFDAAAPGFQFALSMPWLPDLGVRFALGLDGMSLPLFVLAALVAFASTWCAWEIRGRHKEFWALHLLLCGGGLGAFAAEDLFLFYFFFELEVLVMFVLIGIWGRLPSAPWGRTPLYAATKLTLFVATGSLAALLGFLLLYQHAGTYSLAALATGPRLDAELQRRLFLVFLAGFGTMFSLWPLHSWSPLGYAAAPTPVSMVSAGVFKNVGAYGLLRVGFALLPDGARAWAPALAVLAMVNILYAGWVTLRQRDWKFLAGYASVSHIGYVVLGLASLNLIGFSGALFSMVAHGIATALLFALIGFAEAQTGARTTEGPGGLARALPFAGTCTVIAALALCGQPGTGNFVGEILVFLGGWKSGGLTRVATVAAVWGIVLTAVYMLRAIRHSYFGPRPAQAPALADLRGWERFPILLLLILLLALGVAPRLVTDRAAPALQRVATGLQPAGLTTAAVEAAR